MRAGDGEAGITGQCRTAADGARVVLLVAIPLCARAHGTPHIGNASRASARGIGDNATSLAAEPLLTGWIRSSIRNDPEEPVRRCRYGQGDLVQTHIGLRGTGGP